MSITHEIHKVKAGYLFPQECSIKPSAPGSSFMGFCSGGTFSFVQVLSMVKWAKGRLVLEAKPVLRWNIL